MSRKGHIVVAMLLSPLLAWVIMVLAFRLPVGGKALIEGDIHYRSVDLHVSVRGLLVEPLFDNRRLWLVDGRHVYLDDDVVRSLQAEDAMALHSRGQTRHLVLEAYPVIGGGYHVTRVKQSVLVNRAAKITK